MWFIGEELNAGGAKLHKAIPNTQHKGESGTPKQQSGHFQGHRTGYGRQGHVPTNIVRVPFVQGWSGPYQCWNKICAFGLFPLLKKTLANAVRSQILWYSHTHHFRYVILPGLPALFTQAPSVLLTLCKQRLPCWSYSSVLFQLHYITHIVCVVLDTMQYWNITPHCTIIIVQYYVSDRSYVLHMILYIALYITVWHHLYFSLMLIYIDWVLY